MREATRWQYEAELKDFCATQLVSGSLALVLGAGVSIGCQLPNWETLTRRAFEFSKKRYPKSCTNEQAAERLLVNVCRRDELAFANLVRKALYSKFDVSASALTQKNLLCAIGAMAMASVRGSITRIISFNFDDLLEEYLRYLGFSVESIAHMPYWQKRSDFSIFHPHGLLPSNQSLPIDHPIIMALIHYDAVLDKSRNMWEGVLLDVFRSNTCLFIGLSGEDPNLRKLLATTKTTHVSQERQDAFWGIRFSDNANDPQKDVWEERGVIQHTLSSYDALPSWLFEVCQKASAKAQFG